MKKLLWIILLSMTMLIAACNNDDPDDSSTNADGSPLGSIQWSTDANTIVLRLDERRNESTPIDLADDIPACTLWGDGRLVWINNLEDSVQVLEARLSEEQIRALLENVIFTGFYTWESNYMMPGSSNPAIQSITLNLYSEDRTVSRYTDWAADGYNRILQSCTSASTSPGLFLPEGGWVTAVEILREDNVGYWNWNATTAGFSLAEVAAGQPKWVTGDLAKAIWQNTIENPGQARVIEGDKTYMIAIQVPNISRDSPPPEIAP